MKNKTNDTKVSSSSATNAAVSLVDQVLNSTKKTDFKEDILPALIHRVQIVAETIKQDTNHSSNSSSNSKAETKISISDLIHAVDTISDKKSNQHPAALPLPAPATLSLSTSSSASQATKNNAILSNSAQYPVNKNIPPLFFLDFC